VLNHWVDVFDLVSVPWFVKRQNKMKKKKKKSYIAEVFPDVADEPANLDDALRLAGEYLATILVGTPPEPRSNNDRAPKTSLIQSAGHV